MSILKKIFNRNNLPWLIPMVPLFSFIVMLIVFCTGNWANYNNHQFAKMLDDPMFWLGLSLSLFVATGGRRIINWIKGRSTSKQQHELTIKHEGNVSAEEKSSINKVVSNVVQTEVAKEQKEPKKNLVKGKL